MTFDGQSVNVIGTVSATGASNVDGRGGTGGEVAANGSSVAVRDNRIERTVGSGILLDGCQGCLITENTIQTPGDQSLTSQAGRSVQKWLQKKVRKKDKDQEG